MDLKQHWHEIVIVDRCSNEFLQAIPPKSMPVTQVYWFATKKVLPGQALPFGSFVLNADSTQ